MPRLSWSPLPRSPKVFTCRRKQSRVGGWRADPGSPGRTGLSHGAPSLPAAALCSPRSPRGSAGRAPGAPRRSRPCRRGSGGGGRLRERGRLTRETKARSPWPAAPLPAGRCLQGEQCAAHRSPPRAGGTRGAARRGPSSRRQQAGPPPPSSLRGCSKGSPAKSEARQEWRGKCPRSVSKGAELPRDSSEQPLRSDRPGTCGGARPSPGN